MNQRQDKNLLTVAGLTLTLGVALIWASSARKQRRAVASTALPLGPVVNPIAVRVDGGGDGHYGFGRIGHNLCMMHLTAFIFRYLIVSTLRIKAVGELVYYLFLPT